MLTNYYPFENKSNNYFRYKKNNYKYNYKKNSNVHLHDHTADEYFNLNPTTNTNTNTQLYDYYSLLDSIYPKKIYYYFPNDNLNESKKEEFKFDDEFEKNFINSLINEIEIGINSIEGKKDVNETESEQDSLNKQEYKKEYKWIDVGDINNLRDLIKIGKKWKQNDEQNDAWSSKYEYNINLELINNLIPELEDLEKMIGLQKVKSQIIDLILYWALGLENKNEDLLHTVIEGEPGTGKTELAEKLAKIYLKLGILKNNIFKKVKRADLVAGYLGQTAIKTAGILEECKGGVLFIDEAYSLGNPEGKDGKDSFSKECIDTLNQHLTEAKNDFVCIIAGYAEDLANSFFSYNYGLERRFPIRFVIEPYSDEELGKIFVKKVLEYGWNINIEQEEITQIIKSNRKYFKFNGGDMEVLFSKCKISHGKNLLRIENKIKKLIDKKDLLDGLKLFILNPNVKKRENEYDSKESLSYLYI